MTNENTEIDLRHGDCLDLMRAMPDNSVDSIVTDPPYGLSFMGKAWDKGVPSCDVWKEALRVLKPGGHLLAFAGTRTQHRMACAIEDAGFEIRDMIAWVYGSGFPKSHNVSKAIDKAAGAEREAWEEPRQGGGVKKGQAYEGGFEQSNGVRIASAPATEAAKQWDGWGSALKPALEPITVARKPLAKGNTIAANVLEHGTGAINVDGCRVEGVARPFGNPTDSENGHLHGKKPTGEWKPKEGQGRWPANFIHSGEPEVLDLFPVTGSSKAGVRHPNGTMGYHGGAAGLPGVVSGHNDNGGSAARFFYCAKASKKDRDEGCEGLESKNNMRVNGPRESEEAKHATKRNNHHPTVKPTDLMRYLCRLVTPPNGTVLDPFMGSGSTGKAAVLEGFNFIGCELDAEYIEIAKARIGAVNE